MKSGNLTDDDRRQVRQKIRTYRTELRSRRGAKTGKAAAPKAGEMPKGGTQEQAIEPGVLVVAPAGVEHGLTNPSDGPLVVMVVVVPPPPHA